MKTEEFKKVLVAQEKELKAELEDKKQKENDKRREYLHAQEELSLVRIQIDNIRSILKGIEAIEQAESGED